MAKKRTKNGIQRKPSRTPVFSTVLEEENQSHATRKNLFLELGKQIGRPVVTCFTSFKFPVQLDDSDADMLEEVLRHTDLSRGVALMVSSPGGDGLAVSRIISLCRSLSGTGDYWAIVPARAMSAATLLCFGASRIYMSPSSQLGPVDPQIIVTEDGHREYFSAHDLVKSYKQLFDGCVNCAGHIEPHLQQLSRHDARKIGRYEDLIRLSKDISVQFLKSGMLKRMSEATIEKRIQQFLDPELNLSHGRPIFREDARACGLRIIDVETRSAMWNTVYELFLRSNHFVSNRVAKCIETADSSFFVSVSHVKPG
jgi:hypothetical protein